jgi:hypothetical protein
MRALLGGWAAGRLGGWAAGRLGGWAAGRKNIFFDSYCNEKKPTASTTESTEVTEKSLNIKPHFCGV